MSAPNAGLARYIALQTAGAPMIGGDDFFGGVDDDIGGCMQDGYELGAVNDADAVLAGRMFRGMRRAGQSGQQASQNVRRRFAQRAAAWAAQNGWTAPGYGQTYGGSRPYGGGGYGGARPGGWSNRVGDEEELGGAGDEEELGAVDDAELAAIDDEIGALEADDDEVAGEGREELGASVTGLSRRIKRQEALIAKLEARYNSTPERRFRKRQRLLKRIERVRKSMAKKQAKLDRKTEKLAVKLGIPVAAVAAAGAGAAAGYGVSHGEMNRAENDLMRGAVNTAEGFMSGWGPRHAPNQLEVTLPFTNGTSPALYLTKAIGAAGAAGAATINTPAISYADFELVGVDLQATITLAQAADVPPVITVSNWGISGGFNQVYAEQPITHAGGQVSQTGAGILTMSKTLPALRQDKLELGRTNTASLTLNFWCLKANAGVIDVVVTGSLKLRTKRDDNLSHWR